MSPASLLPTFPTSFSFCCPLISTQFPRTFCVYPFSCVYPCACVILTAILMKRETVEIQFVQQGKTQQWQTLTHTRTHAHPFTYKKQPKILLRRLGLGSEGATAGFTFNHVPLPTTANKNGALLIVFCSSFVRAFCVS